MRLLEVDKLSVARAGAVVVRDVSFDVDEGSVVGLLGPNGAGKSTIADAISGFVDKSGSIKFAGDDITRERPHEIARRGLLQVSQERDLFPPMSVRDHLSLGTRASRERGGSPDLDELWKLFPRLKERQTQIAGSMSGGEQQMLAVARALMGSPRLLVLDEPSTGLAPVLVSQLGEYLAQLARAGITILLIEQNVGIALKLCERLLVLKSGHLVFSGVKEELGLDAYARLGELYV